MTIPHFSRLIRWTLLQLLLWCGFCSCQSLPEPLAMTPVNATLVTRLAGDRGLVPVNFYAAGIRVQLPYATPRNAFNQVLYPPGFPALAAKGTALKLAAAQKSLRPYGLSLMVLDAYRPPEVQWQIYQLFRDDAYVADPRRKWSKHCYGRAVDVTLTDKSGRPLEMPSEFDDFSKKAAATYTGDDPAIRYRLGLLQKAMRDAGFSVYSGEWWHFNDLSDPAQLDGPPVFGRDLGLPVKNSGASAADDEGN